MPPRRTEVPSAGGGTKLTLPIFLKMLTAAGLPMDKAIAVASKIYKTCNTPAALGQLTDGTLSALYVADKEHRKLVLAAVKKAGYKAGSTIRDPATAASSAAALTKPSTSNATKPLPKKRKRDDDLNELLPEGPRDEGAYCGSLEFDELLDEQALRTKSAIVNRAPVMTAWAVVVAEHMGFKREEALSIASVYTEMNATSKGVRLGIFEEGKGKGMEATQGDGQPYVDFMGRRRATTFLCCKYCAPLFSTQSSQWRALLNGEPVSPSAAFKYITNALRQTTGYIIGAMRIVTKTYSPQELNRVAFSLYAEFRPQVDGWGKKGEVRCETILGARRGGMAGKAETRAIPPVSEERAQKPDMKKPRVEMSVEEYEAALDEEGYEDLLAIDGP
ncbi:hypothetical protein JB92DRAFT_2809579 [Gautieria morchelliformis]|nr:hypothetical protein JB92DRAFT_2809579 [Gautieria morchelliformis]